MTVDLRADLLRNIKDSRIRDNQSVRPDLLQFPEVLPHAFQIFIVSQNICRYIHFYVMGMGEFDSFLHLFHGKIFCLRPQTECLSADIDRVRAEYNRRFQNFQTACRNQ